MNDARKLRVILGRDGFQMELVEDRREGATGTESTTGQRVIWFLSILVTGVAIANAVDVFLLR
jgi:hypothetical protein